MMSKDTNPRRAASFKIEIDKEDEFIPIGYRLRTLVRRMTGVGLGQYNRFGESPNSYHLAKFFNGRQWDIVQINKVLDVTNYLGHMVGKIPGAIVLLVECHFPASIATEGPSIWFATKNT